MKTDHDTQLLQEVAKSRSRQAFHELFEKYSAKIFKFALSNGMDETSATDLVQEVMTTVWTKAALFSAEKGQASTWIFTVARNARFDMLRKKTREGKHITSADLWQLESTAVDPKVDLEERLSNKELARYVEQLPTQQKSVIRQVYFNGLTQEEYARKNSVPLGTVKSRIRLALRKLNQFLEPQ